MRDAESTGQKRDTCEYFYSRNSPPASGPSLTTHRCVRGPRAWALPEPASFPLAFFVNVFVYDNLFLALDFERKSVQRNELYILKLAA